MFFYAGLSALRQFTFRCSSSPHFIGAAFLFLGYAVVSLSTSAHSITHALLYAGEAGLGIIFKLHLCAVSCGNAKKFCRCVSSSPIRCRLRLYAKAATLQRGGCAALYCSFAVAILYCCFSLHIEDALSEEGRLCCQMSSRTTISAASPRRGPSLSIRV